MASTAPSRSHLKLVAWADHQRAFTPHTSSLALGTSRSRLRVDIAAPAHPEREENDASSDESDDAEDDDVPTELRSAFSLSTYEPSTTVSSAGDLYRAINVPTFALVREAEPQPLRVRDVNAQGEEGPRKRTRRRPPPRLSLSARDDLEPAKDSKSPKSACASTSNSAPKSKPKPKTKPKSKSRTKSPNSPSTKESRPRRPLQAQAPNAA